MNTEPEQTEESTDPNGISRLIEDRLPEIENAAGRLADHVRSHPVPYTLVGAGLALVALRALTHHRDTPMEAAAHAVERAGDRARQKLDHLADRAALARDTVAERAAGAKDKAIGVASRANRSVNDFAERNPLLVGVGIVAARFLAELILKRKSPPQAAQAAQTATAGDDPRKTFRDFLRAILDEKA